MAGFGLRVSGITTAMPMTPATMMGTLTKNTEPQSLPVSQLMSHGCSSSRPPAIGPMATAAPTDPAHTPIARPRSCGGNTTVRMASEIGRTDAPLAPMMTRNAMSWPGESAKAHSADEAANRISPMMSTVLRPYRSPSTPQVNSSAAKASE